MAKASNLSIRAHDGGSQPSSRPVNEDQRGLLSGNASDDDDDDNDIIVHPGHNDEPPKTPRTPNRVRFSLPGESDTGLGAPPSYDSVSNGAALASDPQHSSSSSHDEPFLPLGRARSWSWSNDPANLLTGPLEHLNRPKSSLRSAMSNMANSIIGAGIIGQPYALKQAGLLAGVVLLVVLTITVDWTIRLIVINSKLSGRDSFQGTVEHCFGKPGLIAISVAQWAFAFGGMVAFGVIVGDSIPHVLQAIWPGLGDVPFLWLLTDRRAVIFFFIMAISWPLSLYRDIAKVCASLILSGFAEIVPDC